MIPDTQRAAYEDVKDHLPAHRRAIYGWIESQGGSTLFELCVGLKWPVNRVSGRVTELHQSAHIVDSGRRRINPDSGKRAIVWITRAQFDSEHQKHMPVFHRDGQGELF